MLPPTAPESPNRVLQTFWVTLSGIWSHPSFPGFEPPASGPGPVVNTSRRPQGADVDGRTLPPTNSILVSNPAQLVGDYTNPILKPQAAEVVKKHGEISLAGVTYPTPANQCWPQPVPYIFKIIILYSNPNHEFRQVRLNQPHPRKVTPSWYGDSVGHYDGGTPSCWNKVPQSGFYGWL
jgi:hypothetical protein